MSTKTNEHSETSYFDLHTSGIGYLNRIRKIETKKAPYYAVTISAMRGSQEDVSYTYLDCVVSGNKAVKRIQRLKHLVDEEKKVLIGFKVSDIYLDRFTYTSGEKKGESGAVIKGRLFQIRWAKCDHEHVFPRPDDTETVAREQTAA